MKCPQCSHGENRVLEARPTQTYKRRRRECISCGHRWTTMEIEVDEYYRLKDLAHKAKQFNSIVSKGIL